MTFFLLHVLLRLAGWLSGRYFGLGNIHSAALVRGLYYEDLIYHIYQPARLPQHNFFLKTAQVQQYWWDQELPLSHVFTSSLIN
jgi:hypothetical protein